MSHRLLLPALLAAGIALAPRPLAAQGAPSAPSAAEHTYTLLIYERPADLARRTDPQAGAAYWAAYDAFAGRLAQAGVLRGGTAIDEGEAHLARGRGGADRAVAGARLGGYFVIEVATLEEAMRWAAAAPAFAAAVEVRRHRANPAM